MTLTLTEFLLARIAEDEKRLVHEFDCDRFMTYDYGTRSGDCDCDATARLLAECEAKRTIVLDCQELFEKDVEYNERGGRARLGSGFLRVLAAIYADHPDYDKEWAL